MAREQIIQEQVNGLLSALQNIKDTKQDNLTFSNNFNVTNRVNIDLRNPLPDAGSANEGKVLFVVNGKPQYVNLDEPGLIVEFITTSNSEINSIGKTSIGNKILYKNGNTWTLYTNHWGGATSDSTKTFAEGDLVQVISDSSSHKAGFYIYSGGNLARVKVEHPFSNKLHKNSLSFSTYSNNNAFMFFTPGNHLNTTKSSYKLYTDFNTTFDGLVIGKPMSLEESGVTVKGNFLSFNVTKKQFIAGTDINNCIGILNSKLVLIVNGAVAATCSTTLSNNTKYWYKLVFGTTGITLGIGTDGSNFSNVNSADSTNTWKGRFIYLGTYPGCPYTIDGGFDSESTFFSITDSTGNYYSTSTSGTYKYRSVTGSVTGVIANGFSSETGEAIEIIVKHNFTGNYYFPYVNTSPNLNGKFEYMITISGAIIPVVIKPNEESADIGEVFVITSSNKYYIHGENLQAIFMAYSIASDNSYPLEFTPHTSIIHATFPIGLDQLDADLAYKVLNPIVEVSGAEYEERLRNDLIDPDVYYAVPDDINHHADFYEISSRKGKPNGYAPLDENTKIPLGFLHDYLPLFFENYQTNKLETEFWGLGDKNWIDASNHPYAFEELEKVAQNGVYTLDANGIGYRQLNGGIKVVSDSQFFATCDSVFNTSGKCEYFQLDINGVKFKLPYHPNNTHTDEPYRYFFIK